MGVYRKFEHKDLLGQTYVVHEIRFDPIKYIMLETDDPKQWPSVAQQFAEAYRGR